MPEIGTVMRALELQRLVETKVTEWRERSARVAGPSVADSYQHNFKRHTNRRKNSAEINRIIAKYSKPIKRTDERRFAPPSATPVRPARKTKLKASQSEDNLANIGVMDSPMPVEKPPRGIFSKYNARSCEDIAAFVDFQHTIKSKNFEENSILNSKTATATPRTTQYLHSISEAGGGSDMSAFDDSGLELRHKPNFVTSTPISSRKTCPVSDSISVIDFEKCPKYHSVSELKKGNSEPDILSRRSVDSSRTLDFRKPLKLLKQPFKKGTLDRILRWRGKKPGSDKSRFVVNCDLVVLQVATSLTP